MISRRLVLTMTLMAACGSALASMTISGTRVIFPETEREVIVRTNNKGHSPTLVQVWVDDGNTNANLNQVKVPFLVTPPVFRVEPGKGQSVRMIYNGMSLPEDRESVFWFNMLEIPPKAKDDGTGQKLELAFRTRIKIFYRPKAIEKSNSEFEKNKLQWDVVNDEQRGKGIKVTNQTPYYFSFDSASVISQGKRIALAVDMVAPSSARIFYPKNKLTSAEKISGLEYRQINDYGASLNRKFNWSSGKGFIANND